MKRISALMAIVLVALAGTAPAFAGGLTFELPRLTFPEPPAPVVGRACSGSGATSGCRLAR